MIFLTHLYSETVPIQFSLKLKPSDPDFPFDLESLNINLEIPETYPQDPCLITSITNDEIPTRVKNQIMTSWKSRAQTAYKNKPMLMGLFRWLDNNMEKLLIDQIATQDFELARQGIQIIVNPRQNLKITATEPPKETTAAEVAPQTAAQPTPAPPAEVKAPAANYATITEHRGTQIQVENLNLINLGILECTLLKIVLLCQRCRSQYEVSLAHNATWAAECDKCHNAMIATYRKDQMHEASKVLGYLDVTNVIPFDVLTGSVYCASCLECSENIVWKQIPMTGMEYAQNCENCHKKASVTIER